MNKEIILKVENLSKQYRLGTIGTGTISHDVNRFIAKVVKYPYASTLEEQETKLRYDLYYIKERNSFLDFKIIIKTISTVLFMKGQ